MGIFDRLSTLIKSNLNDLISSAENPEKMLNQIIVDMRNQLAKAKQQVAAAIADEKRLKDQADAEFKLADDWEKRAMLAVQEGRDDLAKQALLRGQEHLEHGQALATTWEAHKIETEKLKQSLRDLNDGPIGDACVTLDGAGDDGEEKARIATTPRRSTGIGELDRVLGGGMVPDSFVLLGGDPGIGKSTLMLQAAARLAVAGRTLARVRGRLRRVVVIRHRRRVAQEQFQLAGVDLLALLAEQALEQELILLLQQPVLRTQRFVLSAQGLDLGGLCGYQLAKFFELRVHVPVAVYDATATERFLLHTTKSSSSLVPWPE